MLDPTPLSSTLPTVKEIDGRKLSRRLRKGLSPAFRALLARDLTAGEVRVHHLTRSQALLLTRASGSYLQTVQRLEPAERAAVGRGLLSLAVLHNSKRKPPADLVLDALITEFGPDKVLAALDRVTAPTSQ